MSAPEQFRDLPRTPRKKWGVPEGYDPLATCPSSLREKYAPMAERARRGSLTAAVRLKCLECCAWSTAEVDRCEISSCALWARARRKRAGLEGAGVTVRNRF